MVNELDIFSASLELQSAEERGRYLDQACGDSHELRRQIDELLWSHSHAGSFMKAPVHDRLSTVTIDDPIREAPGTVIGPYKLLQQIGEGGMGTVFMAEQAYPVRRKVALKVIKPGMDSRQVIARFEAERQALAMMEHPNIAKVLDAGAIGEGVRVQGSGVKDEHAGAFLTPDPSPLTPLGRPYFVMELVHGVPITKFCDDNRLTPRQRLELFVPVCQAIQHAHEKGIIHRDVKPANVMVTLYDGKPVPKVIDFGVAKATEQRLTDRTLFTQYGTMVGTLEYMSPEQAELSARGADTRSDIFSLGVLLYELLTGSTPLSHKRLKEAPYGEALRLIREEEAPKPSTRLSDSGAALVSISAQRLMEPANLTKLLRGELDWIVMKALEKDRQRRYESASAFAADVQHYLHGEPVNACPPSASYRFRKFAGKHCIVLTTFTLVAATLVLGTGISIWQAMLATAARREADANLEKAQRAVEEYFVQVSQNDLLNVPGLQPLRKDLLETALRYYQDILERSSGDPRLRAELARTYTRVALINHALGSAPRALENHQNSLALWHVLAAENPGASQYQAELGTCYVNIGHNQSGQGQLREALASLQQGCAILEKLVAAHPHQANYQKRLARAYSNVGLLHAAVWRLAGAKEEEEKSRLATEALHQFRLALDIREALVRDHPAKHEYKRYVAQAYSNIGLLHQQTGKFEEALRAHERTLEIRDEAARLSPDNLTYEFELGKAHSYVGFVYRTTGDWNKAIQSYERALEISKRVMRRSPAVTSYQREVSRGYFGLEIAYRRSGQPAKALGAIPPRLDILERVLFADFRESDIKRLVDAYCLLVAGHRKVNATAEAWRAGERATTFLGDLAREHPTSDAVKEGLARVHAAIAGLRPDGKEPELNAKR